jgi:hypothetical protein
LRVGPSWRKDVRTNKGAGVMRVISAILVAALLPSTAVARSGYTPHYCTPTVRAAPTYRSAPIVRAAPTYRSAPIVRATPTYRSAPMVRTYAPALRTHQGASPNIQHQSFSRPAVIHAPTIQHVPSGIRTGPNHFNRPMHTTMTLTELYPLLISEQEVDHSRHRCAAIERPLASLAWV